MQSLRGDRSAAGSKAAWLLGFSVGIQVALVTGVAQQSLRITKDAKMKNVKVNKKAGTFTVQTPNGKTRVLKTRRGAENHATSR